MAETRETGMVERVARAISGAPFPSPASYRKARAAIEAMREPTDEMVRALGALAVSSAKAPTHKEAWQAMIDGALSQELPHDL